MTDITERLRLRTDPLQMLMSYPARPAPDMLCHEAADKIVMLWKEIQELKADRRAAMTENHDLWREVERLRAALSEIVEECRNDPTVMDRMIDRIEETARAALEGEKADD
jgi:FtsZ-binding cell division protein ZapB